MDTDKDINFVFAFIKYEGKLVEDGFLDARKAGEALIGIDESLRYFIYQENPDIQKLEIEIPVRVRKGSWEALFPENLDEVLLKTFIAWSAAKYAGSALSEMAKNDFKNFSFKDIFKSAFKGMTWVIKMATHLGTITKKKFENVTFSKDNKEVGVKNDKNETLWIPVEYLELFANCPDILFSKLAKIIETERELVIGYKEKESTTEVRVTSTNKYIFVKDEDTDEILFPDFEHNQYIELSGHITRGNEKSNTMGFLYEGHILTCYPEQGNIKNYKYALFTNAILKGYIDRMDKDRQLIEKRPRIRFISIKLNEPLDDQTNLV